MLKDSRRTRTVTVLFLLMSILSPTYLGCDGKSQTGETGESFISLPEPLRTGEVSLEEALNNRRSVRFYSDGPMTLTELSQLLWSAQGITSEDGFRTAPSAGALYPLTIYAVAGNVDGLDPGIHTYRPADHTLETIHAGDFRQDLFEQALQQSHITEAAVNIVITAIYERTTQKYGERGRRYVLMEVGHVGQNICLQAQSLNLGACPIGAFDDTGVKKALGLPEEEDPLYILSIGRSE